MLIIRLTQTSFLIIFSEQKTQAMCAAIVATMSASLLRELSPYRRPSDNVTALLAQWLIYVWVIAMLARLIRVIGSTPGVIIGVALVGATALLTGHAVVMAKRDLVKAQREMAADRDVEVEMTPSSPSSQTPTQAQEGSAASGAGNDMSDNEEQPSTTTERLTIHL